MSSDANKQRGGWRYEIIANKGGALVRTYAREKSKTSFIRLSRLQFAAWNGIIFYGKKRVLIFQVIR